MDSVRIRPGDVVAARDRLALGRKTGDERTRCRLRTGAIEGDGLGQVDHGAAEVAPKPPELREAWCGGPPPDDVALQPGHPQDERAHEHDQKKRHDARRQGGREASKRSLRCRRLLQSGGRRVRVGHEAMVRPSCRGLRVDLSSERGRWWGGATAPKGGGRRTRSARASNVWSLRWRPARWPPSTPT